MEIHVTDEQRVLLLSALTAKIKRCRSSIRNNEKNGRADHPGIEKRKKLIDNCLWLQLYIGTLLYEVEETDITPGAIQTMSIWQNGERLADEDTLDDEQEEIE